VDRVVHLKKLTPKLMSISHIQSLENCFIEAMRTADLSVMQELIDESLIFNIPGGVVISKSDDLEAYKSGTMHLDSLELVEQEISVQGDVAVVNNLLKMNGSYGGSPFGGNFRVMRVWKNFDGSWRLIAGSSAPAQ